MEDGLVPLLEEEKQEEEDGGSVEVEKEECRICGDVESSKRNKLITPCECAGSISKVHVECLEKWILNRPGNRAAGDNLECEICHAQYKIQLKHRLRMDVETMCTCASLSHLMEALLMAGSLTCVIIILYSVLPSMKTIHRSVPNKAALVCMIGIVFCTGLVALRRLFLRWYRTTSTPRVSLV